MCFLARAPFIYRSLQKVINNKGQGVTNLLHKNGLIIPLLKSALFIFILSLDKFWKPVFKWKIDLLMSVFPLINHTTVFKICSKHVLVFKCLSIDLSIRPHLTKSGVHSGGEGRGWYSLYGEALPEKGYFPYLFQASGVKMFPRLKILLIGTRQSLMQLTVFRWWRTTVV